MSGCQNRSELVEIRAELKAVQESQRTIQDLITGKATKPGIDANNAIIDVRDHPYRGNPKARAVIIEFSDFQCPFCRQFAAKTFGLLVTDYVDTGKLRYVAFSFPLPTIHPLADRAAKAAQCAYRQGKFWEAHGTLMNEPLSRGSLNDLPINIGLDATQWKRCVDDASTAQALSLDAKEGERLGINGTPTFIIGATDESNPNEVHAVRILQGSLAYQEFRSTIEDVLKLPPPHHTGTQ
jgi:protein-disulfide isomerase